MQYPQGAGNPTRFLPDLWEQGDDLRDQGMHRFPLIKLATAQCPNPRGSETRGLALHEFEHLEAELPQEDGLLVLRDGS